MSPSHTVLIIGSGPKVGACTAKAFANKGYKVALASRSQQDEKSNDNELHISVDLAQPESVPSIFDKTKAAFGAFPDVVIYNGYAADMVDPIDPFGNFDQARFREILDLNAVSLAAAIHAAVKGFRTLPASTLKTFIFTGNILPLHAVPDFTFFGAGKSAGEHLTESAYHGYKNSKEYMRFYFADERHAKGGPVPSTDGEAHAKAFRRLAEKREQDEYYYTFARETEGEYKDFGGPKNSDPVPAL